ncbi:MAG TPA: c-type cytochrome [Thermoanaerobaculia bacterium]|nr:c-type cytochrome [Thermoanaerobaculia bacterium]
MKPLLVLTIAVLFIACGGESPQQPAATAVASQPAGDPKQGKALIEQYGCIACHVTPGIDGSHGALGPSLAGMASRPSIAGRVSNDRPTMVAYLQNPPAVDPQTRMPPLGVSEDDARHMTAYLFTLR